MTFSIVGRCAQTGMLGVVVTTSSISVGSRCPWARAGAGAVVTQNITDPGLGDVLLDLLDDGFSASEAMNRVIAEAPYIEYRQLAVVDADGNIAHHTGEKTLGTHGVAQASDCVAAGNLLANTEVPGSMVNEFVSNQGVHLAERLLCSLEAGVSAGGEMGSVRSAALLVVHEHAWPLVDLRVDWCDDPVKTLRELWGSYEPQMEDYMTRALDPATAPAYGVPGDL
ncbi:MAG: DUF1028 domain-containing protein [Gammaproteobacteria bacterium]|nr:DUF1028 domain-containing protein [Gammaproteobacteria bacterium]